MIFLKERVKQMDIITYVLYLVVFLFFLHLSVHAALRYAN